MRGHNIIGRPPKSAEDRSPISGINGRGPAINYEKSIIGGQLPSESLAQRRETHISDNSLADVMNWDSFHGTKVRLPSRRWPRNWIRFSANCRVPVLRRLSRAISGQSRNMCQNYIFTCAPLLIFLPIISISWSNPAQRRGRSWTEFVS